MKIAVIGCYGAYGSWVYNLLQENTDHQIIGIDKEEFLSFADLERYIGLAKVIILAVSLPEAPIVLNRIKDIILDHSLLIDISSSKKEVAPIIEKTNCDYVLIHPMCAPPNTGCKIQDDRTVYAIDYRFDNPENGKFYMEFKDMIGGNYVAITPERHDSVEDIQATSHHLLMAFASSIAASGMTFEEAKQHATPVSLPMFEAVERFLTKGNPQTTAELINLAARNNSIILGSANSSIKKNNLISVPNFTKRIAKRFKRLKRNLFGS